MVKIWYAVCGEGLGHAVRSYSIIERLKKKHNIWITAAERAYPYLKKKHNKVDYIWGNTLVYKDNKQMTVRSLLKFSFEAPYKIVANTFKLLPKFLKFKPDIIISDFESASHYFSKIFRIPCISIDNIHFETETKYQCDKKLPWYLYPTIWYLHPRSKYYIITAFANLIAKKKRTYFVPPIIREDIKKLKPIQKDFVLVYQTSTTNKSMLPALESTKNHYKIYGMKNPGKSRKNVEFKSFNEKGFMEDLRKCKYIIINGGFTTLSEALYLKKAILANPIMFHFEQYFNAYSIKKKGYGDHFEYLTKSAIKRFEKNLGKYRANIRKIKWDHEKIHDLVEKIITNEINKKSKKKNLID